MSISMAYLRSGPLPTQTPSVSSPVLSSGTAALDLFLLYDLLSYPIRAAPLFLQMTLYRSRGSHLTEPVVGKVTLATRNYRKKTSGARWCQFSQVPKLSCSQFSGQEAPQTIPPCPCQYSLPEVSLIGD